MSEHHQSVQEETPSLIQERGKHIDYRTLLERGYDLAKDFGGKAGIFAVVWGATFASVGGKEAFAAVQCAVNQKTQCVDLAWNGQHVETAPLGAIGDQPTNQKIENPMFEAIQKEKRSDTAGVNSEIKNHEEFDRFLLAGVERARHDLKLPFRTLAEMKPRDLLLAASHITTETHTYDWRMVPNTLRKVSGLPSFDHQFTQAIDNQPVDVRFAQGKGVCRNYAVDMAVATNEIKLLANSPWLQNITIDTIFAEDEHHAWNTVVEVLKSNHLRISAMDTTWADASEGYASATTEDQRLLALNAKDDRHANPFHVWRTEFAHVFTDDESYDALAAFSELSESSTHNLSVANELLLNAVFRAEKKYREHDTSQARALIKDVLSRVARAKREYEGSGRTQEEIARFDRTLELFFNYLTQHAPNDEERMYVLKAGIGLDSRNYLRMADQLKKMGRDEAGEWYKAALDKAPFPETFASAYDYFSLQKDESIKGDVRARLTHSLKNYKDHDIASRGHEVLASIARSQGEQQLYQSELRKAYLYANALPRKKMMLGLEYCKALLRGGDASRVDEVVYDLFTTYKEIKKENPSFGAFSFNMNENAFQSEEALLTVLKKSVS